MRKKGYTLVELLIVMATIALLIAILAPAVIRVSKLSSQLSSKIEAD